jgi:hypothetical protein
MVGKGKRLTFGDIDLAIATWLLCRRRATTRERAIYSNCALNLYLPYQLLTALLKNGFRETSNPHY